MKKNVGRLAIVLSSMFVVPLANSTDFGTYGQTYPVVEKSIIEAIIEKFQGMMDSGEWDAYVEEYKQKTVEGILKPKGRDFPIAISNKTRNHDPSIAILEDIPLPNGDFLAKKGDMVNPLDNLGLSKPILFIDGREKNQIEWAIRQKHAQPNSIIILTDGEWMKQIESHGVRFYFDQLGHLSDRFDIQRTPSKVTQNGRLLKIEEFAL